MTPFSRGGEGVREGINCSVGRRAEESGAASDGFESADQRCVKLHADTDELGLQRHLARRHLGGAPNTDIEIHRDSLRNYIETVIIYVQH